MATCKFCNQTIQWKTSAGQPVPVEPELVNYDDLHAGDYLVTEGGNMHFVDGEKGRPDLKGYLSHINRCPGNPVNRFKGSGGW